MFIKKLIVIKLEHLCAALDKHIIDHLPEHLQMRWCCQIAMLSDSLDQKWKTGVWE